MRLQVLDAVLGLGLHVPRSDSVSGSTSDAVKREVQEKFRAMIVDSVFGLAVHPNDGRHFEYVFSADGKVHKPDASYLLEGLRSLWAMDMTLDDAAEDATCDSWGRRARAIRQGALPHQLSRFGSPASSC